ncbi:phosphoribosyltransferase family protein [Xanthomarina sp. F1114]|uniref:ComF family protein n=1 Tax=Xanthomarina sp. F1114 TaxID=2996019 RepID=UPI00225E590D|nr:phosphoribosyltransferase family protein [Xanthomarina sp. F1114]MCX7546365.1 phosphoribosyltransferase family protein [Xanthomarina sp. F1114]
MLKSVLDLFFPKVCFACQFQLGDFEQYICTNCRHSLPVTNFHLENDDSVLKIFYGRAKLEQATALLRFEKKGITQQLIHNLKYKGHEDVGLFLGKWLGSELKETKNYENIDLVIPVPLHKKKLKKRGYNQVAKFGQEIALQLNTEYCDDVLIKITNTASQVNKSRLSRWINNDELFSIQNKEKIENKHVLLVDDIITTGATMEACISVLNKAKNVKISMASMAIV